MTSSTRLRLSMNPLTATLSMRFVVATYFALRTFSWLSAASPDVAVDKVRRTRGDSSLSTPRAWSAMDASLAVGKGTSTVLSDER
jgi:hypothetical protein